MRIAVVFVIFTLIATLATVCTSYFCCAFLLDEGLMPSYDLKIGWGESSFAGAKFCDLGHRIPKSDFVMLLYFAISDCIRKKTVFYCISTNQTLRLGIGSHQTSPLLLSYLVQYSFRALVYCMENIQLKPNGPCSLRGGCSRGTASGIQSSCRRVCTYLGNSPTKVHICNHIGIVHLCWLRAHKTTG